MEPGSVTFGALVVVCSTELVGGSTGVAAAVVAGTTWLATGGAAWTWASSASLPHADSAMSELINAPIATLRASPDVAAPVWWGVWWMNMTTPGFRRLVPWPLGHERIVVT